MQNLMFIFCTAAMLFMIAVPVHAVESYGNQDDPVVAEVLGMEIRTKNPDEMQWMINQKLFQNYARQNKIEASQEDVDLYLARMEQLMRDDQKKNSVRKIEIQQQLKAGSLSTEQVKRLQAELDMLKFLDKQTLENDNLSKQDQEEMRKTKQTMAKSIIEQWQINKALYQQYGGRIIGQQLGPEPLDAMHDFLKEQQKKGSFKILDKSFETGFWEYFVNDSKHSFYKKGSDEELQAFDKPAWER